MLFTELIQGTGAYQLQYECCEVHAIKLSAINPNTQRLAEHSLILNH